MSKDKRVSGLKFAIVSTDIILLRLRDGVIEFATQPVDRPPHYVNMPGLIGGVLLPSETSRQTVARILSEKTDIDESEVHVIPLGFYDAVDRDLRGRVVSLAYIGILEECKDGGNLTWQPLRARKQLAYDHGLMVADALLYMHEHLFGSTIALNFMKKEFIVSELKCVYDYIHGSVVDKRNFYKFLELLPITQTTKECRLEKGRPARIYKKAKSFPLHLDK